MVDADLLDNRLALVETRVQELHTLARPDRMRDDVREQRFVLHTLQLDELTAFVAAVRNRR